MALSSADDFLATLGLTQEIVLAAGLTTCDILAMDMATLTGTLTGFGFYNATTLPMVAGAIIMQSPLFPVAGCCTYNGCLTQGGTPTGYDASLLANLLGGVTSCSPITAFKNNYAYLAEFLEKGKQVE